MGDAPRTWYDLDLIAFATQSRCLNAHNFVFNSDVISASWPMLWENKSTTLIWTGNSIFKIISAFYDRHKIKIRAIGFSPGRLLWRFYNFFFNAEDCNFSLICFCHCRDETRDPILVVSPNCIVSSVTTNPMSCIANKESPWANFIALSHSQPGFSSKIYKVTVDWRVNRIIDSSCFESDLNKI